MVDERDGWRWFEREAQRPATEIGQHALECLITTSGQALLAHLRQQFIEKRLPASASADELRHLEGARCAIAYIEKLARDYRSNPVGKS